MSAAYAADLSAPVLHTQDARGVHRLVLNRAAAFNTLGEEVLAALQAALDAIAADGTARAVVITAEGKAFCAGHNLKEMGARPELAYYQKLFAQCTRMEDDADFFAAETRLRHLLHQGVVR